MPDQDVSRGKAGEAHTPVCLVCGKPEQGALCSSCGALRKTGQAHTPGLLFTEGPTTRGGSPIEETFIVGNEGWAYSGDQKQRTIAVVGHWRDRPNGTEDANRLTACWNACRGLSAEQVALIPSLATLESFGGLEHLPAKLAAFDAMRVALDTIVGEMQNGDFPAAAMLKKLGRAALKLADETEKAGSAI